MITLTAPAPEPLSRSAPSDRPPLRVGLVQHRWRADRDELVAVLRDGIDRAAGRRRRGGVPARDHAAALPRRHPGRAQPRRVGRGPGRRPDLRAGRLGRHRQRHLRARLAVREVRRRRRAGLQHRDPGLPRRRAGGPHPQAAHPDLGRLLRGHLLPAGPAPTTPTRSTRPTVWTPASACRPAGTNGSPRSPAATRWPAPRSSSTPPPSAPSRSSPTSTPARCGSRSSSPTASTAGCSWWCPTGSGDEGKVTLLRFVVHLRSVRPSAGAGAPRRGGCAGGRPRSRPAPRLAGTVPVPVDPPPRHLRRPDPLRWRSTSPTVPATRRRRWSSERNPVHRWRRSGPATGWSPTRCWSPTAWCARWADKPATWRRDSTASTSTSTAASSCRPSVTVTPTRSTAAWRPSGPAVRRCGSVDEIVSAVKKYADEHPDEDWIVGASYDGSLAPGGLFDARWLDAVVPDRPVVLRAWDYHTMWCQHRGPASVPASPPTLPTRCSARSRTAPTDRCSARYASGVQSIW